MNPEPKNPEQPPAESPSPTPQQVPEITVVIPEKLKTGDMPPPKVKKPKEPNIQALEPKAIPRMDKRGGRMTKDTSSRAAMLASEETSTKYPIELLMEAWESKEDLLTEDYAGDTVSVGVALRVLERVAEGERWARVLLDNAMSWSGFYGKYIRNRPRAHILYHAATRLCQLSRRSHAEDEIYRRAIEGYDEEVYTASGKFAGMRKQYSDPLLALFAKATNPAKYGPPGQMGTGGGSGVVLQVNLGISRTEEPEEKQVEAIDADDPRK